MLENELGSKFLKSWNYKCKFIYLESTFLRWVHLGMLVPISLTFLGCWLSGSLKFLSFLVFKKVVNKEDEKGSLCSVVNGNSIAQMTTSFSHWNSIVQMTTSFSQYSLGSCSSIQYRVDLFKEKTHRPQKRVAFVKGLIHYKTVQTPISKRWCWNVCLSGLVSILCQLEFTNRVEFVSMFKKTWNFYSKCQSLWNVLVVPMCYQGLFTYCLCWCDDVC